jgi:hypothetical protein
VWAADVHKGLFALPNIFAIGAKRKQKQKSLRKSNPWVSGHGEELKKASGFTFL